MPLPLHDRAMDGHSDALVRLTEHGLAMSAVFDEERRASQASPLLPARPLQSGEQYRFHFDMTRCIGCRSCEVACNEQNGNPAEILWRRIGELEGGSYPDTQRRYLSMGCNHCLDADCLRGCPVNAYTKDATTGIVLHSAEACIGCQYCVWNCPYSVPQFNPERGVVGKCDMCKGRLEDSLEPACVNACPEAAIQIEIVNVETWRQNFAEADSPGMPSAGQTVSTTRITLPPLTQAMLERVDAGQIQPEHAHLSLVLMTMLMQLVSGSLLVWLLVGGLDALRLGALFVLTNIALGVATMHLGRPAYAWRALKMWRRSWLSREILCFTLFVVALGAATVAAAAPFAAFVSTRVPVTALLSYLSLLAPYAHVLCWTAGLLGVIGTLVSSAIYLVPARPAWNMLHTPIDFLLSAALLGTLTTAASGTALPLVAVPICAVLWLSNQLVRLYRLQRSSVFEARAASSLLLVGGRLRPYTVTAIGLVVVSVGLSLGGAAIAALLCGIGGVLLTRYLFFVSVVPLNMALTFVRARHA